MPCIWEKCNSVRMCHNTRHTVQWSIWSIFITGGALGGTGKITGSISLIKRLIVVSDLHMALFFYTRKAGRHTIACFSPAESKPTMKPWNWDKNEQLHNVVKTAWSSNVQCTVCVLWRTFNCAIWHCKCKDVYGIWCRVQLKIGLCLL